MARDDVVHECRHGVHVAGRLTGAPSPDLRGHEPAAGSSLLRGNIGQAPARIPEVGNDSAPRHLEHERGGHDAPQHHSPGMRVLGGAQEVAHQGMRRRDGAWAAAQRLRQTLPIHPRGRAVGEASQQGGGIDVADRGMIQRPQGLRLAQEPGAAGRVGREVRVQGHRPLEDAVPRVVYQALGRGGHQSVHAKRRCQRLDHLFHQLRGRGGVQRGAGVKVGLAHRDVVHGVLKGSMAPALAGVPAYP